MRPFPELEGADALLSLVLLALGTALCLRALKHRRWELPGVVIATAGVVGWLVTERVGPVLLIVFRGTGVHVGDLLSVPAGLLVLWLCYRGVRR